jgi:hypothetical protein
LIYEVSIAPHQSFFVPREEKFARFIRQFLLAHAPHIEQTRADGVSLLVNVTIISMIVTIEASLARRGPSNHLRRAAALPQRAHIGIARLPSHAKSP